MITTTVKPASTKQIDYIKSMADTRDLKGLPAAQADTLELIREGETVDMPDASKLIDELKLAPKKTDKVSYVTPGIYQAPNGDVIKVVQSRGSKNVYANLLVAKATRERLTLEGEVVDFDYEYAPGLITYITPAMKMGAAEATAFGIKYSRCIWCKKELKKASSVLQGMGATCAKKFV